jgi:hypothetical protein
MRALLFCALLACSCGFARLAHSEPRELTIREAKLLVLAEIKSQHTGAEKYPGFNVDHYPDPSNSRFTVFNVNWKGAASGGMTVDNFSVNMRTADIWKATFCQEVRNASVRRAQRELRRKMHLSNVAYRKYRVPGPFCESAR